MKGRHRLERTGSKHIDDRRLEEVVLLIYAAVEAIEVGNTPRAIYLLRFIVNPSRRLYPEARVLPI